MLTYTSVAYSPASDFWTIDRYKGTVTLVEPPEGVNIIVKNDVYKPE